MTVEKNRNKQRKSTLRVMIEHSKTCTATQQWQQASASSILTSPDWAVHIILLRGQTTVEVLGGGGVGVGASIYISVDPLQTDHVTPVSKN